MRISFSYPTSKANISVRTPKRTVLIPVSTSTAQIIEVREHHETNITSSGGGGWVSNGSGYIHPPKIRSQTVRVERVWLRTPGTRDRCETLRDSRLEPCIGQYVTTVLGDNQTVLYRYNHGNGKLEYSDKQVRSYLSRHVPTNDFVKEAVTITLPLVLTILLYLFGLKLFPPLVTRLLLLIVLVQLLPLIRNSFVKLQERSREVRATMLELEKAIQSIQVPRSASA